MELTTTHYKLIFSRVNHEEVYFFVQNPQEEIAVRYDRNTGTFAFENHDEITEAILENQFQLKKIIHSALKGRQPLAQPIHFSFIRDFPFMRNEDFNRYIQVDRRNNSIDIQANTHETENIYKLYTDGSYSHETKKSGYAGIIEDTTGQQQVFHASSTVRSSNLVELLAIINGLERLKHIEKIQVNTDSRFAIRGLAQWIHFWKLNDWHTAQGTKVKFAEYWQELDRLGEGKLLELKWIRRNSGDSNHTFCHQMAKEIATGK